MAAYVRGGFRISVEGEYLEETKITPLSPTTKIIESYKKEKKIDFTKHINSFILIYILLCYMLLLPLPPPKKKMLSVQYIHP